MAVQAVEAAAQRSLAVLDDQCDRNGHGHHLRCSIRSIIAALAMSDWRNVWRIPFLPTILRSSLYSSAVCNAERGCAHGRGSARIAFRPLTTPSAQRRAEDGGVHRARARDRQ